LNAPWFIGYANANLIVNPEIFFHIFKEFVITFKIDKKHVVWHNVRRICQHFENFMRCSGIEKARAVHEEKLKVISRTTGVATKLREWEVNVAFSAVFGYESRKCPSDKCKIKYISDGLSDEVQLNCCECDQHVFQTYLDRIISGKNFDEIDGDGPSFYGYLKDAVNSMYWDLKTISLSKSNPLNQSLRKVPLFLPFIVHDDQRLLIDKIDTTFSDLFFTQIIGYNLADFMINNNRRRLKKCPYCDNYFIANNVRRIRCFTQECQRKHYRIKKRRQREENPALYY